MAEVTLRVERGELSPILDELQKYAEAPDKKGKAIDQLFDAQKGAQETDLTMID